MRPGLNAYQRWNGPASVQAFDPATGAKLTPAERGLLRDEDRYNQLGGSIGGPIVKNKVFIFFNYEIFRFPQSWNEAQDKGAQLTVLTDAARSEPADPFIRTQSTWQPAWPLCSWRSRPARRSTGCARTVPGE